jgi:hypothetical protein
MKSPTPSETWRLLISQGRRPKDFHHLVQGVVYMERAVVGRQRNGKTFGYKLKIWISKGNFAGYKLFMN